jgi:translation initiation factor 5
VNGAHETHRLSALLEGFIKRFVQCGQCNNPETEINLTKRETIELKCKACGAVTQVDMRHKLCTFILKNPPVVTDKGKKCAPGPAARASRIARAAASLRRCSTRTRLANPDTRLRVCVRLARLRRAEKERIKEGEALDKAEKEAKKKAKAEKGDKPEKGDKKEKKEKKASKKDKKKEEEEGSASEEEAGSGDGSGEGDEADDDDVTWSTDTSAAAAAARAIEQARPCVRPGPARCVALSRAGACGASALRDSQDDQTR